MTRRPDFDSLVRWPLDTDGWRHTVFVGALLSAAGALLVPTVLLSGYVVRLLRTDFEEDDLPTFTDLRSLAETGARATGVLAVYSLPALVLLAVGVGASAGTLLRSDPVAMLRPATAVASAPSLTLSAALVVAGVASLPLSGYLGTIALTAYATTGSVAAAFDPGRVRRRARSTATLRAWLLGSLAIVGTTVLTTVLAGGGSVVPGVGPLVSGAVRFYGVIVAVGLWSTRRPPDDEREDRPVADTEPDATAVAEPT